MKVLNREKPTLSSFDLLRNLKKNRNFLFQMLLFCSHFSNGILSRDLKDACRILNFPENWLVSLAYIFLSSKPNFCELPESFDTIKTDLLQMVKDGKSEQAILQDCRKSEQVTSIEILTLNDIKIGDRKEILIVIDQSIRAIMDTIDETGLSLFEQKINVLEYYSFLFNSILKQNKQHHYYWESFVECTMLNSNSIAWKFGGDLAHLDDECYVLIEESSTTELQDLIRYHDTNIRVLMNDSSTLSLKEGFNYLMRMDPDQREAQKDRFFRAFEWFLMPLWTICKIHEYYEIALDYINLYRQLNSTEYSQANLIISSIKTELFACDVHYKKLKKSREYCSPEDLKQIEVQFEITKQILTKCPESQW